MSTFATGFHFPGLPLRPARGAQVLTMAVMLMSIFGFGSGHAAAQGTTVQHSTTNAAIAEGVVCFAESIDCSYVNVYIGPGKVDGMTVLCLGISGADMNGEACADVSGTFAMDAQHLTYAELPLTTLTFELQECDKSGNCSEPVYRDVTISGSWAGIGDRTPIQETIGDPHGSCTQVDMINGFVRDASVTLLIDGQAADVHGFLQSLDSHQQMRTNCG